MLHQLARLNYSGTQCRFLNAGCLCVSGRVLSVPLLTFAPQCGGTTSLTSARITRKQASVALVVGLLTDYLQQLLGDVDQFRSAQTSACIKIMHAILRPCQHGRVCVYFMFSHMLCCINFVLTRFCLCLFVCVSDSCKFLHDRSDYKHGWQLEREMDQGTYGQEEGQALYICNVSRDSVWKFFDKHFFMQTQYRLRGRRTSHCVETFTV